MSITDDRWNTLTLFREILRHHRSKRSFLVGEKDLRKKIAKLESMYDQMQAEMKYLDKLLMQIGFEQGLKTLKMAAIELLEKTESENNKDRPLD